MKRHWRPVEKSQTLLLNEQSKHLEQSGKTVYKFGFGESPFMPIPFAIEALQHHAGAKSYSAVQGILPLRERVAQFHSEMDGVEYTADHVLVAPGSKILIYAIMAAFVHADVLIPVPSWVSYLPQAQLLGHRTIKIHTRFQDRWRLTASALSSALQAKTSQETTSILILNYPGNPDGLTYSASELQELVEVLRRYRVWVIADEIYGLLHHQGNHQSLARYYPECTIVTTGLSKWCGAGGWRLGVALLPRCIDPDFKEALLGIASETYSCAPTPIQLAACAAYEYSQSLSDYLWNQRTILSRIGHYCAATLSQAGIAVHAPEGGFYLFLDFTPYRASLSARGMHSSHEVCQSMLSEIGVALLPGDAFGMDASYLSARLAYVDFDGAQAMTSLRACTKDTFLLSVVCPKMIDGIHRITMFLNEYR